jgi:cytochrome P450
MPLTNAPTRRLKQELPPAPSHPRVIQTVGGQRWPFAYLEYCRAHIGTRFTLYPIDMPPIVFLSNPADIRVLLAADAADLHPGAGAHTISPLIGDRSFMLLEEDEHIYGRRVITPAFHQRTIAQHTILLTEMVEREIWQWPLDTAVPLHPYIRALTLRVILRTIFSDQPAELEPLHNRLMMMLTITTSFILQEPKLRHLPGWRGTWQRFVRQRAAVDQLILELINRRRREGGPRGDLLDLLLDAENMDGSRMGEREIRDNLMSMILAGHETTTGELAWAFQLLAHTPRVQERLVDEIDAGTGEEYMTATVHETMRHKPVFVFIIPRKVINPVEIGGWTYPPTVHLAGCTYLMHHDPQLYPKPHEFAPERFLGQLRQPRTYLPWGGGRKHCLGRHFALLEIKTILRLVLSTRKILSASRQIEQPRWRSAILVPRDGGRVIMRKRAF